MVRGGRVGEEDQKLSRDEVIQEPLRLYTKDFGLYQK